MKYPLAIASLLLVAPSVLPAGAGPKPLQVFVLAGQSNMEGPAVVDLDGKDYNGGKGTLKYLLNDPAKGPKLRHLADGKGGWAARDDVWVRYQPEGGPVKAGRLAPGFTPYGGKHHFGPELQFGHVLGDHFDNHVHAFVTVKRTDVTDHEAIAQIEFVEQRGVSLLANLKGSDIHAIRYDGNLVRRDAACSDVLFQTTADGGDGIGAPERKGFGGA